MPSQMIQTGCFVSGVGNEWNLIIFCESICLLTYNSERNEYKIIGMEKYKIT
jgi:hypothetical protein